MQPTLVDAVIAAAFVGTVLSACHRGLAREALHTVLFALAVLAGYLFFKDVKTPQTQPEIAKLLTSAAFFLAVMYVLMWAAMRVISPLVLSFHPVGMRSRFWAGALSTFKLIGCTLVLNLWFAVHSPDAHPLRLEAFPQVVRESLLVNLSDRKTDDFYRWLAAQNVLSYNKYVEKAKTPEEGDEKSVDSLFGITTPGGDPTDSSSTPLLHKMEETPESVD